MTNNTDKEPYMHLKSDDIDKMIYDKSKMWPKSFFDHFFIEIKLG